MGEVAGNCGGIDDEGREGGWVLQNIEWYVRWVGMAQNTKGADRYVRLW